jgi:hypothetical protein
MPEMRSTVLDCPKMSNPATNSRPSEPPPPSRPRSTKRGPRPVPYRLGLVFGASLALAGIAGTLAFDAGLSPLLLLVGWLVMAWSTHRMGRSGPLLGSPTSHSAAPR